MAVTQRDRIFREILALLRGCVSDEANVYLADTPTFTSEDAVQVQVIPGQPRTLHPRSGLGLIVEVFRVCFWTRLTLDQTRRIDQQFANADDGLNYYADIAKFKLNQNFLDDQATIPCLHVSSSGVTADEGHPGWGFIEQLYEVHYEENANGG